MRDLFARIVQRRWAALLALLAVVAIGLAVTATDRAMRSQAIAGQAAASRGNAAILASGLRSELDKFSLLPLALADDPDVRALLAGNRATAASLNRRLEQLAVQSRAAAIYVMDARGLTLAASNWNLPTSFVGSNYAFRRYFTDALAKGSSTQFALGTVSRQPGLYIARRIGPADRPVGIVAVKVEFDGLERAWRAAADAVYVTDADGVILITSEPAWRFQLAGSGDGNPRDTAADLRQFGIARLQRLDLVRARPDFATVKLPLLDTAQPISPEGWTLHLLADPAPRAAAAVATGRLGLALLLIVGMIIAAFVWAARRRRIAQSEALLAERTGTLRDQLSQANRLATLGQISAGVAHEIGQPVAAARVYAESGGKLLAKGQVDAAALNFGRIIELTDRIGAITGELRRFSRRQPGERTAMPVGRAIDGAMLLLRDRIASVGAAVTLPPPGALQETVVAEHVRLEQVLVNLLQNALDAAGPGGEVRIALAPVEGAVELRVSDNGPGLAEDIASQLFQPFMTTKTEGLGLGLVISRDIMRDLGGDLAYEGGGDGACFMMRIPRPQ